MLFQKFHNQFLTIKALTEHLPKDMEKNILMIHNGYLTGLLQGNQ